MLQHYRCGRIQRKIIKNVLAIEECGLCMLQYLGLINNFTEL